MLSTPLTTPLTTPLRHHHVATIVKVTSRRSFKRYYRYKVQVLSSFRGEVRRTNRTFSPRRSYASSPAPSHDSDSAHSPPIRNVTVNVYVLRKNMKCKCLRLRTSKRYVILTGLGRQQRDEQFTVGELLLNRESTVLGLRNKRKTRLHRFAKMKSEGKCKRRPSAKRRRN